MSAVDQVEKILLDEGAAAGHSIHSWRCEYPDRYGPCTCVRDLAELIVAEIAPAPAPEVTA